MRKTLPWKNTHIGLPEGNQAIRTPSPVQGLTRDPGELTPVLAWRQTAPPSLPGVLEELHQGSPSGELNWRIKRRSYPQMRGNGAASVTPASSSCPLPVTQHTGRDWLNVETVESREGVRVAQRPALQIVCYRGVVHQRIGESIPRGHGSP